MFSKEGGWPSGEVKDSDAIYEQEKQIEAGNPVRDVCYRNQNAIRSDDG